MTDLTEHEKYALKKLEVIKRLAELEAKAFLYPKLIEYVKLVTDLIKEDKRLEIPTFEDWYTANR